LTSVQRRDVNGGIAETQATSYWSYDAARRVRSRMEGTIDSFWYDPAGLETRRKSARGHVVTQYYDAMGRLTARIIPEVVYLRESCWTCTNHLTLNTPIYFPYFNTALLGGGQSIHLVIPGDMESFTYDAAGRMLTANNRDARVSRSYYNNGALKSDTLRIRPYDTADTITAAYNRHVFGQSFTADLLGRRTSRSDWQGYTQLYTYHSAHGQLITLDDVYGSDTLRSTFTWDAAGRPDTTSRAGVVTETRRYDSNGRLESRDVGSLFNDDYLYDSRGKLSTRNSGSHFTALSDSVKYWYDGFGAVVASDTYRQYGGINSASTEYSVDALGNVFLNHLNRGYNVGQSGQMQSYNGERVVGRATQRLANLRQADDPSQPRVMVLDSLTNAYDEAGNLRSSYSEKHHFNYSVPFQGKHGTAYYDFFYVAVEGNETTRQFYDGAQRLRQFERNVLNGSPWHTVQQYRYDALGRRVLLRTLRDSTRCSASQTENTPACLSTIDRFVWDGDQMVAEYRAKGRWNASAASLDTLASAGAFFGSIRYVHASGIDDPILVAKNGSPGFIPIRSGRGGFEAGLWLNGTDMTAYHWPARADGIYPGPDVRYEAPVETSWYGSLLDNKTDASGMIYMRNRYYDPGTGRFTQRDPIGLAGGMNQYGYAGGDPVNYSDPFGLDGCEKNDLPCLAARAAAQVAAGVAGMLAGAGTGAALGTIACGPPVCSAAGAAVGSLVGGVASAQAAGQQFDAALEMANAGKGRGANQSPNNEVREIARRNNLNEAGRSELHRQISRRGMSREEIEEIAKTIGEQAKYTTNGTP
jgi:RHS repeat-associated protein